MIHDDSKSTDFGPNLPITTITWDRFLSHQRGEGYRDAIVTPDSSLHRFLPSQTVRLAGALSPLKEAKSRL